MKKYISVIAAVALLLGAAGLCACKNENPEVPAGDSVTQTDGQELLSADENETGLKENENKQENASGAKGEDSPSSGEEQTPSGETKDPSFEKTSSGVAPENAAAENENGTVYLKAEKSTVKAGGSVRFYLHVRSCDRFAVAGFTAALSGKGKFTDGNKTGDSSLYGQSNVLSDTEMTGGVFVAATLDLDDEDIYYIDVDVSDDAEAGDVIAVTLTFSEFEVGVDAGGSKTESIVSGIPAIMADVTVK